MKVYNPAAGIFYMLNWWSYDERGHVILTRSESSMTHVAEKVFSKHINAEIKLYQRVELVSPPESYSELYEKFNYIDAVWSFRCELTYRLRDAIEQGETLPKPFFLCTNYIPEDETEDNDWARETHYGCNNCYEGISCSITKEQLYDTYAEKWKKEFPSKQTYVKDVRNLSRGRVALHNEDLHYAYANFGHHSNGIVFDAVKQSEEDISCRPRWLSDDVLFYFKVIEDCDSTVLKDMITNFYTTHRNRIDERDRIEKEARKKQEEEMIKKTINFFKE